MHSKLRHSPTNMSVLRNLSVYIYASINMCMCVCGCTLSPRHPRKWSYDVLCMFVPMSLKMPNTVNVCFIWPCKISSACNILKWVFPKIMAPQIIHFNRVFHHKPSILGYPYFWKDPNQIKSWQPSQPRQPSTKPSVPSHQ